jgi:hypothetical protein
VRRLIPIAVLLGIGTCGCSDDEAPRKSDDDDAGRSGANASGASGAGGSGGRSGGSAGLAGGAGTLNAGQAGTAGVGGGANGGNSGGGLGGSAVGGTGGGGGATTLVELPPGSREFDGIVNLVDADAAAELEHYVTVEAEPTGPYFLEQRLTKSVNLFLEHYEEQYDFIIIFNTGVPMEEALFAGRYERLTGKPKVGTGHDLEYAVPGYRTDGRTRAAIVMPHFEGYGATTAHEVLHEWANFLDPELFPFGKGLSLDVGPHWGFSGVYGQLGGFDPEALRCETPADALPPNCTPLENGRIRYVAPAFGPNANGFLDLPYAPIELYLMGLIPASEAPASIPMLLEADYVTFPEDPELPVTLEAAGISDIALAEIIERHGTVKLMPEAERAMTAAFVVITAEPAPDSVLSDVAEWAKIFGGRMEDSYVSSFATYTGGRATMDTRLGPRREAAEPAPPPREYEECDLIAQDCGGELACFSWPPNVCLNTRGIERGEPCSDTFDCAAGLMCIASAAAPDAPECTPYCDPDDDASPKACATLCPDQSYEFTDEAGETLATICIPD